MRKQSILQSSSDAADIPFVCTESAGEGSVVARNTPQEEVAVQRKVREGILFLRPRSEKIDSTNSPDLKQKLTGQISDGVFVIALDLSEVEFMDSSGLGVMISLLRKLECKGELLLLGVREGVLGLLRITGMVRVFTLYDTEEEVLAARMGRVSEYSQPKLPRPTA